MTIVSERFFPDDTMKIKIKFRALELYIFRLRYLMHGEY